MDCIAPRHTHTTSLRCHPHLPTFEPCRNLLLFWQKWPSYPRPAQLQDRGHDFFNLTGSDYGTPPHRKPYCLEPSQESCPFSRTRVLIERKLQGGPAVEVVIESAPPCLPG